MVSIPPEIFQLRGPVVPLYYAWVERVTAQSKRRRSSLNDFVAHNFTTVLPKGDFCAVFGLFAKPLKKLIKVFID